MTVLYLTAFETCLGKWNGKRVANKGALNNLELRSSNFYEISAVLASLAVQQGPATSEISAVLASLL